MRTERKTSRAEREKRIAELRARQWTLRDIAAEVGMSANGVHAALQRMAFADSGRDPDDW